MRLLLLCAAALAAPVTMTEQGGVVTGTVEMDVPFEAVHALVSDPARAAVASKREMNFTPLPGDGGCPLFHLSLPTAVGDMGGKVRVCATTGGSTITMIESEDFSRYEYSYRAERLASGLTRVTYALDMRTSIPVPASWARSLAAREVEDALENLSAWRPGR